MGLKANIVKAVNEITVKVDEILQNEASLGNPHADTSELETTIDALVYKLYNLSDDEIKIIRGEN